MNEMLEVNGPKLRRYREAGDWLLRLHEPGASEEEITEWLRWCEVDSENLAAFDRVQQDWDDTGGFKHVPELLPSSKAARWDVRSWHRTSFRWAAVAASVLCCALVVAYVQWTQRSVREVITRSSAEPATLPDGSSMLLSAKATADVDFTGTARHVALRSGAEAFMKVHHDPARPFIVGAGAMTVTAVGTAFDVKREADRVIVTVEEGTVVASAMTRDGPNEWRVGAGYQIDYSQGLGTAVVSKVDTQHALSWRNGELAYDDAPLDAVIADINRYSRLNMVIRDPSIGRLRFTGTVFIASVADWIAALEATYPVHATIAHDEITLEAPATARE